MYRKQVNEKSPLRILERSTHGGLGPGNLGVVMARAGVGKIAPQAGRVPQKSSFRGRTAFVPQSLRICRDSFRKGCIRGHEIGICVALAVDKIKVHPGLAFAQWLNPH